MKISELRTLLQEEDGETLVVLSRDSEGNDFSPLAEVELVIYLATTPWSGEIYEEGPLTDAREAAGYRAMDLRQVGQDGAIRALVLWPLN